MILFIGIIFLYQLILAYFLSIMQFHNITLISILFLVLTSILYCKIILILKNRGAVYINILSILFAFIAVFGNLFYYPIKGTILTFSQITLIDELVAVSDTVIGYWNNIYLLAFVFPIITIIMTTKLIKRLNSKLNVKSTIVLCTVVLLFNGVFYFQDEILYTTMYSPVEYAQNYGFASFYARELMPFSKKSLDDVEYEKTNSDEIKKNDYSALFEDKDNVVFITAESFDEIAIDQNLTPTLYKMKKDGIYFENYYTLLNNTNASEFSILTSTHPPVDNSKITKYSGEYTSIPEMFNENDYCTFGFHLNTSEFYDRASLYPNLYKFDNSYFSEDMKPNITLPEAKDSILFEKSIKYIEEENCDKQFTYYMTVYGHSPYEITRREMDRDIFNDVKEINPEYDDLLNSYLTFQVDLDLMMEEMIDYYDEKGELDQTLFIIVADHYPYALDGLDALFVEQSNSYKQQFTGELFETYNIPFMIYDPSSSYESNSKYMSNIDVLPTVADLFNFDYKYAEGESAFDNSSLGTVKWYAANDYSYIENGEKIEVNKNDDNLDEEQIDEDHLVSAKIYSLFE